MQIQFKFKEFEIFLWKKNAFDCAVERPGLESQRNRKRLFFDRKISNSLNINSNVYCRQLMKLDKEIKEKWPELAFDIFSIEERRVKFACHVPSRNYNFPC